MKSFVYGIDGADRRIFEYFEMPFLRALEASHSYLPLQEDLINRGWSEIITGAEGKDTGGFYMSPELGGSTRLSMKYKMAAVPEATGIPLLWDALGENVRVGVMNVPSLNPVASVNGFAVGSAGAGISKVSTIDGNIAFPGTAVEYLNTVGYVADIRLGPSGITDIDELFAQLKAMERIRIDSFIELSRRESVEFGLLIDRGTTVVQYLMMSEIQSLMDRDNNTQPAFSPSEHVESLLRDYYSFVDDNIRRLYEALSPQQFIIVGDHGHAPMTHHCNPNVLLQKHGWYFPGATGGGSLFGSVSQFLFRRVPRRIRARVRNMMSVSLAENIDAVGTGFDRSRSVAFSHWYMPGIYINDRRFGGFVDDADRPGLVRAICDGISADPEAQVHGITATPCREKFAAAKFSDKLPDIRLQLPDSIFVTCRQPGFVTENPEYGPVVSLANVQSDMHTGAKGAQPLCLVDNATAALVEDGDPDNLTLVYRLVCRHFSEPQSGGGQQDRGQQDSSNAE